MAKDYKILSCLICDFAQKGQGNKDMLIGIYADVILISELPARMPLAVWLQLKPINLKKASINLEILSPQDKSIITMSGELILTEDNIIGLPFQIPLMSFPEEGVYKIKFGLNSSQEIIKKFSVIKNESSEISTFNI